MASLTLNKITSQRGIPVGEAAKKIADLGWNPTYVQEAAVHQTDYKITKEPRDPMKQVLRSYFPMEEEKDNGAQQQRGVAGECHHADCHTDRRGDPSAADTPPRGGSSPSRSGVVRA